jgi:hypothetical protein
MNDAPDEETKLTNFLRQHRSIAPAELTGLENRLMLKIDALPTHPHQNVINSWPQYLIGTIGLALAGIAGTTIFQFTNPPEPSIAELDQLNLFLEAHAPNVANHSDLDLELDPDLF